MSIEDRVRYEVFRSGGQMEAEDPFCRQWRSYGTYTDREEAVQAAREKTDYPLDGDVEGELPTRYMTIKTRSV